MKKVFVLLLAAVVVLSLPACSGGKEANLCGTWNAVSVEIDGSKFTVEELEATGDNSLSDFGIVIKEGGKAYIYGEGNGELVDWENVSGGIKIGIQECSIKDGLICVEKDDDILFFEKTSDSQTVTDNSENDNEDKAEVVSDEESSEKDLSSNVTDNRELAGILDNITADFSSTTEYLLKELDAVYSTIGDTYASYVKNNQALLDWYGLSLTKTEELFENTKAQAVKYFKAVVSSVDHEDSGALEDAMDGFCDVVYEDAFGELCDTIYEDAFNEINQKYYEGIIEDAKDSVDYSDWLDVRSDCYGEWLDTRSDFYSEWLDVRSDIYGDWLDVKGEFWSKNFDIDSILRLDTKSDDAATENASAPESGDASTSEPESTPDKAEESIDGMRPEFKEAMESYEAFYDEYCDFMKKYKENSSDLKLLAKYADMTVKLSEMNEKFADWESDKMTQDELKYYLEVNNRITQKLLEVQ